jgi:hypothetical protein
VVTMFYHVTCRESRAQVLAGSAYPHDTSILAVARWSKPAIV